MPAPVYRSGSFHGSFANANIAKPSGLALGDLMVAYEWAWSGFYNPADSDNRLGAPAGWTDVSEVIFGTNPAHGLYYKIADSGDVAASTFTFRRDSNGLIIMAAVQAGTFDPTTPITATVSVGYTINRHTPSGATVTAATITPPVDGCLGLFLAVGDTNNGWTPPAGYTERLDVNGGDYATGLIATTTLTTSATGSVSATASGSVPADQGGSALVAVNPPPPVAPDAPIGLSVAAGYASSSLEVHWDRPLSDGGAAISDYIVQYRTSSGPGSWNTFTDGTSTTTGTVITGLTDGVGYDVQVAAVNSAGTGSYTAPSSGTPVTPTSPGTVVIAPTIVQAPPIYQR